MSLLNRAILLLVCFSFVLPAAYSAEVKVRGPKSSEPKSSQAVINNNANDRNFSNSNSNNSNNSNNSSNNNNNNSTNTNRTYDINTITNSDGSITLSDFTYGPITSADTLWQIATRFKGNNNLSVYQAMYAIYQLNPTAFENSNLNLIKDGFVLELPSEQYIASINKADAVKRFESDTARLKNLGISQQGAVQTAKSPAPASSNISKNELDETKQLIEQKIGALDEAQTRQFMAIRQQFAESITNVQAILDENQKLFERLDSVNTDINEMRAQELTKTQQMTQMGQSIEELLAKSREQDAAKQVLELEENSSWLDNPVLLIGLSSIPALLILGGVAFWLVRRNAAKNNEPMHLVEDDDIELDEHTSALDDLSDALSDELSDELGEDLDDDNLFGEDDLLDDVLAEELSESLDEALDESFDDAIDAELDNFDDLGDDLLEPEDKFEEGSAQIEQSELDSLFDEDDDLAAEQDDDGSEAELINSIVDDELPEPEEPSVDEADIAQTAAVLEKPPASPAGTIAKVADQEDAPEISIDELFAGPDSKLAPSIEVDESEEVNEEMLQQLDKEIAAQNAELDNITGNLLDELEQVEQMRDLMGDDDGEEDDTEVNQIVQSGIKKLDEDSLAEGFDEAGGFEPEFLDVLDDEPVVSPADSGIDDSAVEDSAVEVSAVDAEQEEHKPEDLTEFVEYETDDELEENEPQNTPELTKPVTEDESTVSDDSASEQSNGVKIEPTDEADEVVPESDLIEPELVNSEKALADIEANPELTDEVDELELESELVEPELAITENSEAALADIEANPELTDEVDELELESELVEPELANTENSEAALVDIEANPELTDEVDELEPESELVEPELADTENSEAALADIEANPELTDEVDELEPRVEPEPSVNEPNESADSEKTANEDLDEFDIDDEEEPSQQELNEHANDEHGLDEDELEKALEDFEHQELDEVLEDLTSNKSSALDSLDDLEFGMVADDFLQHKTAEKTTPQAVVDDSDEDLDDSLLEQALADLDEQSDEFAAEEPSDELDDLPGLGDWLTELNDSVSKASTKTSKSKKTSSEDESLLDELEEANFDELLSAINLDEEDEKAEHDGLDVSALLSEDVPEPSTKSVEPEVEDSDDDFLDVEALLNDSDSDVNDSPADKDLDLSTPLASFFGDSVDGDSIDVDGDSGFGAKLDLAHAYIEIGENESAVELLEEIIASGNEQLQSEAQTILNSLSTL